MKLDYSIYPLNVFNEANYDKLDSELQLKKELLIKETTTPISESLFEDIARSIFSNLLLTYKIDRARFKLHVINLQGELSEITKSTIQTILRYEETEVLWESLIFYMSILYIASDSLKEEEINSYHFRINSFGKVISSLVNESDNQQCDFLDASINTATILSNAMNLQQSDFGRKYTLALLIELYRECLKLKDNFDMFELKEEIKNLIKLVEEQFIINEENTTVDDYFSSHFPGMRQICEYSSIQDYVLNNLEKVCKKDIMESNLSNWYVGKLTRKFYNTHV